MESLKLIASAPNSLPPDPISGIGIRKAHLIGTPGQAGVPGDDTGDQGKERQSAREFDYETIRRAQLGDDSAWEVLVRQNIGWIFRSCSRWAGSPARAEDLTQDVFIRVFHTLHSYRGELAGFRVWLRQITRNLLIDDYRRTRRERGVVSYDSSDERTQNVVRSIAAGRPNTDADIERKERSALVRRALRSLDPELREAVTLRDVQGLSYQEISRLLKTPLGTVKSRVHRGRMELVRLVRQSALLLSGFGRSASAVA